MIFGTSGRSVIGGTSINGRLVSGTVVENGNVTVISPRGTSRSSGTGQQRQVGQLGNTRSTGSRTSQASGSSSSRHPKEARPRPTIRPVDDTVVHPARAIYLLRQCEYDASTLLAPLFYDLSRRLGRIEGPSNDTSVLSSADLERLLLGIHRLRTRQMAAMRCPVDQVNCSRIQDSCTKMKGVRSYRNHVLAPKLTEHGDDGMCSPVEEMSLLIALADDSLKTYKVCADCRKAVIEDMKDARKSMWDSMGTCLREPSIRYIPRKPKCSRVSAMVYRVK